MAKDDKVMKDERPTTKEEKLKALDAAISHIEKQYGKGSVMKLGDNSTNMNVEGVPTGSLSLDLALGIGGLPKGRSTETTTSPSRTAGSRRLRSRRRWCDPVRSI